MSPPRSRILAAVLLAVAGTFLYIVLSLQASPPAGAPSESSALGGESYTYEVEVEGLKFIATVGPAPQDVVEAALNDTTWTMPEAEVWKERVRDGWKVLEVRVTLVNTRLVPVVLAAGGPYCMSSFGSQEWPLDQFPELVDEKGEALYPPTFCQMALMEITIPPTGEYETVYYFIVEPGYEGSLILQPEICQGGECGKVRVEIPLRDPVGGGG